jgi:hypothetical protein
MSGVIELSAASSLHATGDLNIHINNQDLTGDTLSVNSHQVQETSYIAFNNYVMRKVRPKKCCSSSCCRRNKINKPYSSKFCLLFANVLMTLELSPTELKIIENRYLTLIEEFEKLEYNARLSYYISKFIIQTGSLITPAILSIQHVYGDNSSTNPLYWAAWGTSVGVGLLTNYMSTFKLDKRYLLLDNTLDMLRIEGWQFIELTGKYKSHKHSKATHHNRFKHFLNTIELMKRKQVNMENNMVAEEDQVSKPSAGLIDNQNQPRQSARRLQNAPSRLVNDLDEEED